MMQRDDFENRLGQGLKRWATAGEPTLDLEAHVLGKAGKAPARASRRRWINWLGSAAAAVAVVFTLGLTFPSWAGAAAGWPIVGPVIKEIIMKDAGLHWAYEAGLLQQPLAVVTEGDVTVKILAVLADPFRTKIIYQADGLPEPDYSYKPARADGGGLMGELSRPARHEQMVTIAGVEGHTGYYVSYDQPVWTPLGTYGAVSTVPLGVESGVVKVQVRLGEQVHPLELTVSRAEVAKFYREVPVGESKSIGGVTFTIHSVFYTPAETVVKYTVEKPAYGGGWSISDPDLMTHLMVGKERKGTSNTWHSQDGFIYVTFPAAEPRAARLVLPMVVVGQEAGLTWKLEPGTTQMADSTPIELTAVERQGDRLALRWRALPQGTYMGFAGLEFVDAAGQTQTANSQESSWSNPPGEEVRTIVAKLPAGFEPVAIRAKEIGVRVDGPWIFDLPQR